MRAAINHHPERTPAEAAGCEAPPAVVSFVSTPHTLQPFDVLCVVIHHRTLVDSKMHKMELEMRTRSTPRSPPTPYSSPPCRRPDPVHASQCTPHIGSASAPQSRSPVPRQRACHSALDAYGCERSGSVRLVRWRSSSGARVAFMHVVVVGRPQGQSAPDALLRTYPSSYVALSTFSCSTRMSWTLPEARGTLAAARGALYWPP